MYMSYCISSAKWKTPIMKGDRPPPCAYFTINALPDNKGIMFGGVTIKMGTRTLTRVSDMFLLNISQDMIVS